MLETKSKELKGKRVAVSGSGNVAQYAVEKVNDLGGIAISLSDSNGTIIDDAGIIGEKWDFIMDLKNNKRGRIKDYADKYNVKFFPGKSVWDVIKDEGL